MGKVFEVVTVEWREAVRMHALGTFPGGGAALL